MTTVLSWWMGCAIGLPPAGENNEADVRVATPDTTGTADTGATDTGATDSGIDRPGATETSGPCDPGVERDRSCVIDSDCAKVYSDRSYCNCEAVNVAVAWTREDLVCTDWHGPECDYDCVQDTAVAAVCDAGICGLLGP